MPGTVANLQFRALLKTAIGPFRTQAGFASEAGITPEHLSRMLNNPAAGHPTLATLRKIAGHAYGGITLKDLAAACGYTDVKETKENAPDLANRTRKFVSAFKSAVQTVLNGENPRTDFDSIYGFITYIVMVSGTPEGPVIDISDAIGEADVRHAIVDFCFGNTDMATRFAVAVDYSITGQKYHINKVIYNPETLWRLGSEAASIAFDICSGKWENGFKDGVMLCYCKRSHKLPTDAEFFKKLAEDAKIERMAPRELLLKRIFKEGCPERVATCEGVGFYTDTVSLPTVRRFLAKHKDTFVRSEKESEIYRKFVEEGRGGEVFEGYDNDVGFAGMGTWMVAVANIVYRETDIRLGCWETSKEETPPSRPCIMFNYGMPWIFNSTERELSCDSLTQILDRYALELRCELANDCYFTMYMPEEE